MEHLPATLIAAAVCIVGIIVFLLGYRSAERSQRIEQVYQWIQKNWPDKQTAFKQGHRMGYQQGVLQARTLEEDEDE